MGMESENVETIDCDTIQPRYDAIVADKVLILGATHRIEFDIRRDMVSLQTADF